MKATFAKLILVLIAAAAPMSGSMARAQNAVQVNLVESWYHRYLGRHGDPVGAMGHATLLARGTPALIVEAGFLGSPEYYIRNGQSEPSFILAVYRDVLGTSPTPQQMQHDLARLHQLGCDRSNFAAEFLQSHRADTCLVPQSAPVAAVQTYRPVYVAPPRPVTAYRPAYLPVPYAAPYGPGAAFAVRPPGFGAAIR